MNKISEHAMRLFPNTTPDHFHYVMSLLKELGVDASTAGTLRTGIDKLKNLQKAFDALVEQNTKLLELIAAMKKVEE